MCVCVCTGERACGGTLGAVESPGARRRRRVWVLACANSTRTNAIGCRDVARRTSSIARCRSWRWAWAAGSHGCIVPLSSRCATHTSSNRPVAPRPCTMSCSASSDRCGDEPRRPCSRKHTCPEAASAAHSGAASVEGSLGPARPWRAESDFPRWVWRSELLPSADPRARAHQRRAKTYGSPQKRTTQPQAALRGDRRVCRPSTFGRRSDALGHCRTIPQLWL